MSEERLGMQKKSTWVILLILGGLFLNFLRGNLFDISLIGTLIGAIIFGYVLYYFYQAIRYRRLGVGDKYEFELGVLRIAFALVILVALSILLVVL